MISASKELLRELGGPRTVAGGGLVLVFLLLATDYAVDSIQEEFARVKGLAESNSQAINDLNLRITRIDAFMAGGRRFTTSDGALLQRDIDRVERRFEEHAKHDH